MRRVSSGVFLLLSATLLFGQAPAVSDNGVVNGATFQPGPVAPGSLVSIFGSQLSSRTASADSVPLSVSLGGVSVNFSNGGQTIPAPIQYVQADDASRQTASQINVQVPWNIVPDGSSGTVTLTVTRDGVRSAAVPVNISPVSPGIFSSNGRAIVANLDGTLAWPAGAAPGAAHPARAGDAVVIYATGLGTVDSPVGNGDNSLDRLRNTVNKPVVMIGGVSATVLFSGLSPQFPGVNQVNVTVPNITPSDTVPIQIQILGATSPSGLTMAIGP